MRDQYWHHVTSCRPIRAQYGLKANYCGEAANDEPMNKWKMQLLSSLLHHRNLELQFLQIKKSRREWMILIIFSCFAFHGRYTQIATILRSFPNRILCIPSLEQSSILENIVNICKTIQVHQGGFFALLLQRSFIIISANCVVAATLTFVLGRSACQHWENPIINTGASMIENQSQLENN